MSSNLSFIARIARSVILVIVGLGLIVYATQDTLVILQESLSLPVPILPALKAFGMAEDYGFVPFAEPLGENEGGFAPTLENHSDTISPEGTSTPFQITITDTNSPRTTQTLESGTNIPEPTAPPTPEPTVSVRDVEPAIPNRLVIPSIALDAPIIEATKRNMIMGGSIFASWMAPNNTSIGWHTTSARLAEPGNTVLNGHHNVYGKVFAELHKVQPGDEIQVFAEGYHISYVVSNVMIFPERDADSEMRIENARWIQPSQDERLTLVTCWPETSNTHRLIVVAQPIGWGEDIEPESEINMD